MNNESTGQLPIRKSLQSAENDTGRIAFCGPYVLAAITGHPISAVEDVIRDYDAFLAAD